MLEADVQVDRRDFTVAARITVAAGERLALFGPSGAGKTTLLEVIAGLVVPRRARITLVDRVLTSTDKPVTALPPWQRRVGLLRQDPGLFPHLSVRDNLLYGRAATTSETRRRGTARTGSPVDAGARAAEVAELTGILGIDGLVSAMPARLSGGQAHRVALGRLLLSHCDALLLDEPYTGLDASLRRTLTDLVVSLVARRGVPAILVAHELAEAQAFADRLAVLDRGQILQTGAPDEVVLRPTGRRVAELVGYTAFVPVPDLRAAQTPESAQESVPSCRRTATMHAPELLASADPVAGIHPDRVIDGSHPEKGLVLAGVVTSCRPAGALWEIALRTSGVTVTGRLPVASAVGREFVMTATNPPCFGPDGAAVASRGTASQSGQAGARR